MYKKLMQDDMNGFFETIRKLGSILGPVNIGGSCYEFRNVDSLDQVNLTYTRTMNSPKKLYIGGETFFEEKIFDFDEEKAVFLEPEEEERMVIFGAHPCDINALKFLDRIYLDEDFDKYYASRRKNILIIGISCKPDENCFCKSTGTSYAEDGFDLFFHEITKGYFVRIGSEDGYRLVEVNQNIFKDVEAGDVDEFKANENNRLKEFKLELNITGLQDMLDMAFDNPVWKETADICFGCGICNLTCPTCRCYDVVDLLNLDLKTGEKVRRLDSCMLKKHGLVAGGLNFRPTRVERLQNRFSCKGSLREDILNCVGCGRCTVYCPADIDFVEVLKKVRGEL